jgi:hypothetical protein
MAGDESAFPEESAPKSSTLAQADVGSHTTDGVSFTGRRNDVGGEGKGLVGGCELYS